MYDPALFDPAVLERTRRRLLNPWALRAYFLTRLPLALFAGVRAVELTDQRSSVAIPFGWRTTNPFRSMYLGAQAMAAEISTGAPFLVATASARGSVAMLPLRFEAGYEKKADGRVIFTCDDVPAAFEAVARTLETGEPVEVPLRTVGRLDDAGSTVVSRFTFHWSVKRRA